MQSRDARTPQLTPWVFSRCESCPVRQDAGVREMRVLSGRLPWARAAGRLRPTTARLPAGFPLAHRPTAPVSSV